MKVKLSAYLFVIGGISASSIAYGVTNGDELIAVGAENIALGGSGVAHYVGAESGFTNPALLGRADGAQISGGINFFRPDVTNTGFTGTTSADSSANMYFIPDVAYSSRIDGSLSYGVAVAGIAGMGVDYTDASQPSYVRARTSLNILRIIPTIAYNKADYGLGLSPVLQESSLAISFDTTGFGPGSGPHNASHDSDSSTGFGLSLGGYYDVTPTLTLAGAYQSEIAATYGSQLSSAGQRFGQTFGDKLTQPAQMKAGIVYSIDKHLAVTADYKLIQWASAEGYRDFGWKDQNVVAIGGKYAADSYWLGLGYNNANNPIVSFANGVAGNHTNGHNGIGNLFNNLMFPAIAEDTYTIGGGYALSNRLELNGAYAYSPKVTATVDISDAVQQPAGTLFNTSTHSQQSFSVSLRYKL